MYLVRPILLVLWLLTQAFSSLWECFGISKLHTLFLFLTYSRVFWRLSTGLFKAIFRQEIQSRRHGVWWAHPPKQSTKPPQIELWNYESEEFLSNLQCQSPLHKRKAPPHQRFSDDGSEGKLWNMWLLRHCPKTLMTISGSHKICWRKTEKLERSKILA